MKAPKRKSGRGSLFVITGLLLGSGLLRLGDGVGDARAEAASHPPEPVAEAPQTAPDMADISAVLLAFSEREARVAKGEAQLTARMAVLRTAEAQITQRLAELSQAEAALRDTLALADQAAENDLGQLTEVYQNMKPASAAALFEEMSPEFAAGFLGRMRADAAAAIMAGLEPSTAYSISVVLAGRNALVPTE